MEPWIPGVSLILNVKVLSWNVVRDLIMSQISMLTAWDLNVGVNGAHELLTPGKLCCMIKHRSQGKTDGRKLLEIEQTDCSRGCGSDGFSGFDGYDGYDDFDASRGSDGVDGCDGVVVPSGKGIKMGQVVGMVTSFRIGSRSLRRVNQSAGIRAEGLSHKIDGERVEGLSHTIVGEHVAGLSRRKVVKNEMKDSQMLVETVDAGRRIAGTWCGSKEVEWWVAAVAAMATTAPMAAADAMASRVAEVSLNRWSRQGLFVMVKKMVLCASAGLAEAQGKTKVNGLVSMMCWDMTTPRNWLCP